MTETETLAATVSLTLASPTAFENFYKLFSPLCRTYTHAGDISTQSVSAAAGECKDYTHTGTPTF